MKTAPGYSNGWNDCRVAVETHLSDLRAEVERLQKDARRYQAFFDAGLPITYLGEQYETKAELDAAIDAALAATGKGGKNDRLR